MALASGRCAGSVEWHLSLGQILFDRARDACWNGARSVRMFDLTYFATGYWQHVFTRTGGANNGWVYKIPAAFGYVMPFTRPGTVFSARNAYERALKFVLVVAANGFCKRVFARAEAVRGRGHAVAGWALLELLAETIRAYNTKVLFAYCKAMRRRKFSAMLRVMDYVSDCGLGEILFPYKIARKAEAVLRVNGTVGFYKGPMLIQKMADCVFERGESVGSFNWSEVVVGEQRLWRVGVGFSAWREILGPWGLLDGHARVFDTSGLTRERERARAAAGEGRLDRMQKGVLEEWTEGDCRGAAEEYFGFIREEINQERMDELWGADLKWSAGRGLRTRSDGRRSSARWLRFR